MSVELFREAADYAREVTSGLSAEDLRLPTPCEGWDAGMVARHLADVAVVLRDLVDTGDLRMPDSPAADGVDPVARFHEALDDLLATLSTTDQRERAAAAAQAGAIELTTHGRDIAVASDPGHRTPERLADGVLALARSLIRDDERGSRFRPRRAAPAAAPKGDQLAAFLGRRTNGPGAGLSGRRDPGRSVGASAQTQSGVEAR